MRALLAGLLLLLAAPAAAHSGHASLSVVWIDAQGGVTVTHSFAAHDVEPALVAIAPEAQPSLDDAQALAAFKDYVARRFTVEGARLTLQSLDMAGDDVTMVFTGTMTPTPAITVRGALFGETWSDHNSQVNIRQGGITRTLWFMPGDGAKTVRFDPE
ncbi:MAG: DUF6702 family protein [Polymorphobacter sp.]|uniref:DUF6702 family protein n=1 Tax=Polymorphobacter sp. TaxID=1909290 RepID=UPI003A8722DB